MENIDKEKNYLQKSDFCLLLVLIEKVQSIINIVDIELQNNKITQNELDSLIGSKIKNNSYSYPFN